MPIGYQTLAEKPYETHYVWKEIEIDAPVETVWPLAVRIPDWMNAHRLETLDGSPGELGHFEQVFPQNLAPDTPTPHHHFYGIAHLVPLRYIALEVFPERGGSYGKTRDWTMVDQIMLNDLGDGRTRVAFAIVDLLAGPAHPDHEPEDPPSDLLERYLKVLKAQAEGATEGSRA